MATKEAEPAQTAEKQDQTQLLIARLMEGGQEDEETCRDLDQLTKLLTEDYEASQLNPTAHISICKVIDADCVDTILGYLDMRQPELVRAHATLTTSAYLKAAGEEGSKNLSTFFLDRVRRGTYDDYIVAFCVASLTFPIAPELTSELFLGEGFLGSLGPLMRRKWKSRKVETACLEMLNAACSNAQCREAVEKYCSEWLEEVVDQDPDEAVQSMQGDPQVHAQEGSVTMRRHSMQVQSLAAVILAKLRALPSTKPSTLPSDETSESRVQAATTSIEDLAVSFRSLLLKEEEFGTKLSIEGLAYASLRPSVKDSLSRDPAFLRQLVKALANAPPRSPTTYGALSIFANLTRYQPTLTEEEVKMSQLKAYANAAGKLAQTDPLNDNEHVSERCKLVFEAGITPVLVTHSKNGSAASLSLIVNIVFSMSNIPGLRGRLAQQGAVKLLLTSWPAIPVSDSQSRRIAAHGLARILISIDPALVFGGNRSNPLNAAIRPLASILPLDEAAETRDLLPTFESLLALTNLASLEDSSTRKSILNTAWAHVEELLLSSNKLVSKAAVELVCNLVQDPEGAKLYCDGSPQAKTRLHILLALADSEDEGTRSAAGGALAALTAYDGAVQGILRRERGVKILLDMCNDENEGLRHRGAYVLHNIITADGETGRLGRQSVLAENGIEVLKESAKKSRQPQVLEVILQTLKALLEDG